VLSESINQSPNVTLRPQSVARMCGSGPDTLSICCRAQLRDALKGEQPIAIRGLGIKTMRTKPVPNAFDNSLPLLQHQIRSLPCAPGASLRCCVLAKATTDAKPPQPVAKVLVGDAKHWFQDGNPHQRCRE